VNTEVPSKRATSHDHSRVIHPFAFSAKGWELALDAPSRFAHVIISYSQSLLARRTVSTNVLSEPMTAFEPAKFA